MSGLAVLFPGQGSQYVGMGADLARAYPEAAAAFRHADEILDLPLSRICWEGPEEELIQTQNAQPAILVHSFAVWSVLPESLRDSVRFAAGHSLGEFSAYTAAGSLEFEEAVRLVRRRGELMAASREGTMSALVGLDAEVVEGICEGVDPESGTVVAANHNSPGQIVISGDVAAVEQAEARAKELGARMVRRLPVSGAFHSPLMSGAEAGLADELERAGLEDPGFPVVSNVTARAVCDVATARATLVRQLTAPVRWTEGIEYIASQGVRRFVELGPGKVLTGLLRRIDSALAGVAVGGSEEVEAMRQEGAVGGGASD